MEFEIWWIISIPLFFGLGWIAARVDIKQLLSESQSLPRGYFKGLNFLLNEQPDKAIDAFIEIVKLDPETADLHFALGNLFRRRGETERAIRVHQNLLVRPDLPEEQLIQARYELGQDFLKAGLLDRAEEIFTHLTDSQYNTIAKRALLDIFQREKDWNRAIGAAQAIQNSGAGSQQKEIAHFYCELAANQIISSNPDKAVPFLEQALDIDRMNVRATILSGDVLKAQGKLEDAITVWRKIERQSISHIVLVAQRLMDTYQALNRPQEGLALLKSYLLQTSSIDLLEVVFQAAIKFENVTEANDLVLEELKRTPTLLGLDKLLEARLMIVPPEMRQDLSTIKTLVQNYASKLARYRCSHCGFQARNFYWQCPGCHMWETYPPRRTEELHLID